MRGRRAPRSPSWPYLEERVPPAHPLRMIKRCADQALAELPPELDAMYADGGRPSIPPERLLKASPLIALYSVRSERAFCEALDYHLLFRWFLDMNLIEPSLDPTTFTKNRARLLAHALSQRLFDEVVAQGHAWWLLSDEHFTVDRTQIEAAASLKSFRPRDGEPPAPPDDPGNPSVNFRGERRCSAERPSRCSTAPSCSRRAQASAGALGGTPCNPGSRTASERPRQCTDELPGAGHAPASP